MRQLKSGFGALASILALFLCACSSGSNPTGDAGLVSDSGFDGGNPDSGIPDGGNIDPSIFDAGVACRADAGPPGPISLQYVPNDGNLWGAALPVIFSAPDGTVFGVSALDSTGHVSGDVPYCGMVSVLEHFGSITSVTTVAGVEPGESLRVGGPVPTSNTTRVTAQFPAYDGGAGAQLQYEAEIAPCHIIQTVLPGSSEQALFQLDPECAAGVANTTVLVIARTGNTNAAFSFASASLEFPDGGLRGSVQVSLPPWRTDWAQHDLALTNYPSGTDFIYGTLYPEASNQIFAIGQSNANGAVTGGTTTFPMTTLPDDFAEHFWGAGGPSGEFLAQRLSDVSPTMTLDLSSAGPLAGMVMDQTDPPRTILSWSAPSRIPMDLVVAQFSENNPGYTWQLYWSVLAPAQMQFQFPALPADSSYDVYRIQKAEPGVISALAHVYLRQANYWTGYSDLLAQPLPRSLAEVLSPTGGEMVTNATYRQLEMFSQ